MFLIKKSAITIPNIFRHNLLIFCFRFGYLLFLSNFFSRIKLNIKYKTYSIIVLLLKSVIKSKVAKRNLIWFNIVIKVISILIIIKIFNLKEIFFALVISTRLSYFAYSIIFNYNIDIFFSFFKFFYLIAYSF